MPAMVAGVYHAPLPRFQRFPESWLQLSHSHNYSRAGGDFPSSRGREREASVDARATEVSHALIPFGEWAVILLPGAQRLCPQYSLMGGRQPIQEKSSRRTSASEGIIILSLRPAKRAPGDLCRQTARPHD